MTIATKRKITPRTRLKLHKDAYKVALDDGPPAEASRAVVQAMDRVYCSAGFDLKPCSSEEHKHFMHYMKLRRLKLLVNYSDYLGQELQKIWADLKAVVIDTDCDTGDLRIHAYIGFGILGIDANHMLWLINEWGEKNRAIHNQIRQYISDCSLAPPPRATLPRSQGMAQCGASRYGDNVRKTSYLVSRPNTSVS